MVDDDPVGRDRGRPEGLRVARCTPRFTAASTPPALRAEHRTTTWAELVVVAGVVEFREDRAGGPWSTSLRAGDTLAIVPGRPHSVSPSPDAEFYVRFYEPAGGGRGAGSGPVPHVGA